MNRRAARLAVCIGIAAGSLLPALAPAVAGEADEEQRLGSVLRSDKPAAEKDAACARLKQIGTAKAVAALAALLTDEELSHSARYALECIPGPEAGAALLEALGKTAGRIKAGIIDSLGDRREAKAVPALARLLADKDADVASAAGTALGKIGDPAGLAALKSARATAPAGVRQAIADAILLCADRLLAAGDAAAAAAVYKEMYDPKEAQHVRTAAYRGMVLSAGDVRVAMVQAALLADDRAGQIAALSLIREIPGEAATKAFAAVLAKARPAIQAALLESLAQRGDPAALPGVVAVARAPAPAVRIAAIEALATLGDESVVPLLADAAVSANEDEQKAAREAIVLLKRGDVSGAILAHLSKASRNVQAELVRALGYRRDPSVTPGLLKMAGGADESVAATALRAIGMLAGPPSLRDEDRKVLDELIGLVVRAKSDALRDAAENALRSISARSKEPQTLAKPVLAAMRGASVPAQCALLRVAGRMGGADAIAALRAGVAGQDAAVRDAAVRTMAEAAGVEAAPDLLGLARDADDPTHRVLAVRGYWRLVGQAADRSVEQRCRMAEAGLAVTNRPEDKKLALAELAKLPHASALKLAEGLCGDPAVQAEAQAACVRVAAAFAASRPTEAKAVLQRLVADAKDPNVRAEARKALDAMDQCVGYVTGWMVAGPYRQNGKECSQLFDIAMGPEVPGAKVAWTPAPRPADPSLFWQADLSSVVGGNHCLVYLKARVYTPAEVPVRLDIGTDDGIKLWINGKLVHANNAIRGLAPGQDKAQATLRKGPNDLLVKITQHTMGCAACIRFRNADGSIIEGLRFDGDAGE